MPSYFSWIQHISWFRYGNEALLVNQWEDVPEISCAGALNNNSCIHSGHYALQVYSFKEVSLMITMCTNNLEVALANLIKLWLFLTVYRDQCGVM